jgi:DNA-directed RNA polymerase specialized sigma24 family protein
LARAEEVAFDATQDALFRAHLFPGGTATYFLNWLTQVATRLALDHLRKKAPEALPENVPVGARDPDPDDDRATLRRVLTEMPERQRKILEWAYIDNLTDEEIGAQLYDDAAGPKAKGQRARRERLKAEQELLERLLKEGIDAAHWGFGILPRRPADGPERSKS